MVSGLEGRRVVVTGAASGIGRATLEAFREAGAHAAGLDIAPAPDGSGDDGSGGARSGDWAIADLADETAVVVAMADILARRGGLDVLVNCAGLQADAPIRTLDLAAFDRMAAVNLRGAMIVTREALRGMGAGGRIVNVASELAYLGRAGSSGYCATKAGILSLTRSWARELGPDILVNAVAPGPTDTPLLGWERMDASLRALEQANPLGRIGRAEEVARAILFLASPAVTFTTGQCLSVDGGAAMH